MTVRYTLRERPRLGVWEVINSVTDEVEFVGIREDCEEWINDPASRPEGKPADFRRLVLPMNFTEGAR